MDPLTIATSSASVASLCVKTVYTLTKWSYEVAGIDTLLSGLRDEIESVQNVVSSLNQAINNQQPGTAGIFCNVNNGTTLWAQVARSIADAERVLQALDKIMQKFDVKSSGVFKKITKQFKMSLESGEIGTLRQRLVLINSALNLPLQMLNLQVHVQRAENDDSLARVLTEKIGDIESSILVIQRSLSKQDHAPAPSLVDDKDIHGHIKDLAETAEGFASDASIVMANSSSSGTVRGFPVREYATPKAPGRDHVSNFITATLSVYGKPQPKEKHLHILDWIPPRTPNSLGEGSSNETYTELGGDLNRLDSAMDDLEVELHGKRLAKGISLLEGRNFEDAAEFFSRALKRMEKSSAALEVQPLINDVKLLLARSLIGQKRDAEAVQVLTTLVEATDSSDDVFNFSAKHALAELALHNRDVEKAENLCLEVVKGRRRLFGTTNTACYSSIKLLIDIYKALGEPDEVELWKSLLPPSELPRHDRFILCDKELRRLCSVGQADAAAAMGVRFLKDNYEIKPFWQWNEKDLEARWTEMTTNIRIGNGFAGWSAGMCALLFLVMVTPTGADSEIEYLLRHGAIIDATFAIPKRSQGKLDSNWNDCTCLMLAALHGRANTVTTLLQLGAVHSEGMEANKKAPIAAAHTASAFAAAGGHFRLMQELAAHGLGSDQPVTYPNAALQYALMFDQTTIAEWLIQQGMTAPYEQSCGGTMMHTVAENGSMGCMDMLILRGEKVSSKDRDGEEPIHSAARYGTPAAIACLLQNGADIEAQGWHNWTPLLAASGEGNVSCGEFLISQGANVNALTPSRNTVLTLAIDNDRASFVRMIVEKAPSHFESWMLDQSSPWPPVHLATSRGGLEVLQVLLDAAPVSWQIDKPLAAEKNNTLLDYAVKEGKTDCAEMLVKHGASVLSSHGRSTPIHRASSAGNIDMLRILLPALPAGHTIDIPGVNQCIPLLSAIDNDRLECAEFLLDKGASPLCKDTDGWTAIHGASSKGYTELLRAMISALPPDHTTLDIHGGRYDRTPLMIAAVGGSLACVELLLASGASDLTRGRAGWAAAHYAAYNGHADVLQLFLERNPWQVYDPRKAGTTLMEQAVAGGRVETVQQLLGLGVPMFHDAAIRRHGVAVYWGSLKYLIDGSLKYLIDGDGDDDGEGPDPVPMARLLSELYAKHCPRWAKKQDRWSNTWYRDTLRAAITHSNAPLVEILLDAGFHVNNPFDDGQTPLAAAVKGGSDEVVQLLRRRGAK
ncbi:ankyrin [Coniochaeta ligniaria NRRL 30616]|uniref:Ankyrin n=1 Tax=Coniochaeta ligniaria NRRL 30616 TaxID=1408157 RepID=A0A1J7ISX4_9PEZI|nr:ankyrin [Coniochaeta ligniaria NRRL 30616]